MGYQAFDQYASEYDAWFMENQNVLETELRLVASTLKDAGRILSIGSGSALFEKLLKDKYSIEVSRCIEPAEGMAAIARKRGFEVEINTAEAADYGCEEFDTVLFNGCPCYMQDLGLALRKAMAALRPGGKAVVIDVPKESPYGTIYNLALAVGTWDHPLLEGCKPKDPYPIELVKQAAWRTTADKAKTMEDCGFKDLEYQQTLTLDPCYSYTLVEDPMPGHDRGSYVAIIGYKR
ncbi:MAG: class I SAM-dependent methyltransferase [Bacteroidales bacterium]|nr:class I SAM-dependent methyltransferase [Candidatus Cryptobacteroides onthequi]